MKQFNFSKALALLQEGAKIQRLEWGAKEIWLYLIRPSDETLAFIALRTIDNKIVPWTCNQIDLLAKDWKLME